MIVLEILILKVMAVRSIHRYDESCQMSTWLCAIAKNQYRVYQRKHPPTESIDHVGIENISENNKIVHSAETDVMNELSRLALLKKMHACDEPFREILYLRVFGELSFREIGDVLGRSENWARVTYYRGKEKLRKVLEEDE